MSGISMVYLGSGASWQDLNQDEDSGDISIEVHVLEPR